VDNVEGFINALGVRGGRIYAWTKDFAYSSPHHNEFGNEEKRIFVSKRYESVPKAISDLKPFKHDWSGNISLIFDDEDLLEQDFAATIISSDIKRYRVNVDGSTHYELIENL